MNVDSPRGSVGQSTCRTTVAISVMLGSQHVLPTRHQLDCVAEPRPAGICLLDKGRPQAAGHVALPRVRCSYLAARGTCRVKVGIRPVVFTDFPFYYQLCPSFFQAISSGDGSLGASSQPVCLRIPGGALPPARAPAHLHPCAGPHTLPSQSLPKRPKVTWCTQWQGTLGLYEYWAGLRPAPSKACPPGSIF